MIIGKVAGYLYKYGVGGEDECLFIGIVAD